MAVALEGFSIRAYAAKMRTADFSECWPFDGLDKEGEKELSLPPISTPHFRWWSDELEAERSRRSAPDLENDSTPEEKLAVKNSNTGKKRAPKKRSITELFAVAPHIKSVNPDNGEDGANGALGIEARVGATVGGAVSEPPKKIKDLMKMGKNGKGNRTKEILAATEGKKFQPKSSCVVHIPCTLQSSKPKKPGTKKMGHVDAQKKKPSGMKSSSKKHSFKVTPCRDYEVGKVFQARGILKNQTRVNSTKKIVLEGDSHSDNQILPRKEPEKHVRFSGNDDTIGRAKSSLPIDLPKVQSFCKILSDVLAAEATIQDLSSRLLPATEDDGVLKGNAIADTSINGGESKLSFLGNKKQLIESNCHAAVSTDISDRKYPDTETRSIVGTLDLNCAIQSFGKADFSGPGVSDMSPNYSYSRSSGIQDYSSVKVLSSNPGSQAGDRNAQCQEETFNMVSNARSLPASIGVSRYAVSSTETSTRDLVTLLPASFLRTGMKENESGKSIGTKVYSPWHATQSHSGYPMLESERSIELSPASHSLSICREKHITVGLTGSTLHSQGELIKSYSSAKSGLDDHLKNQNLVLGSEIDSQIPNLDDPKIRMVRPRVNENCPSVQDDWLKLFPVTSREPIASSLGIRETQHSSGLQVQNHESVRNKHEPNPLRSCYSCRESAHSAKFRAAENVDYCTLTAGQTTMRLMGIDVTIGKNGIGRESSDDGKVWSDKEIIAEQYCHDPVCMAWLQRDLVPQNHLHPLDSPSYLYHNPTADPLFGRMRFDHTPQFFPSIRSRGFSLNKPYNPLPPKEVQSMTSKSSATVGSLTPFFEQANQITVAPSHSQDVSHQILLNHTHCNPSQIHSNTRQSTSMLPIPNQDKRNLSKPSSWPASSNLEQGLFKTKHQKNIQRTSVPQETDPYPIDPRHSRPLDGTDLSLLSSSHRTSVAHPLSSDIASEMRCSSTPFSSIHASFTPSCSAGTPVLTVNPQNEEHNPSLPSDINPYPIDAHQSQPVCGTDLVPPTYSYQTSVVPPHFTDIASENGCPSTPLSSIHSSFTPSCPARRSTSAVNLQICDKIENKDGRESNYNYSELHDRSKITRKRHAAGGDEFPRPVKKIPRRTEQFVGSMPCPTTRYSVNPACANKVMDVDSVTKNNVKYGFIPIPQFRSLELGGGSKPGPVKLCAGAKHILKPHPNVYRDSSTLIHCTDRFANSNSSSGTSVSQTKATKIYRF